MAEIEQARVPMKTIKARWENSATAEAPEATGLEQFHVVVERERTVAKSCLTPGRSALHVRSAHGRRVEVAMCLHQFERDVVEDYDLAATRGESGERDVCSRAGRSLSPRNASGRLCWCRWSWQWPSIPREESRRHVLIHSRPSRILLPERHWPYLSHCVATGIQLSNDSGSTKLTSVPNENRVGQYRGRANSSRERKNARTAHKRLETHGHLLVASRTTTPLASLS